MAGLEDHSSGRVTVRTFVKRLRSKLGDDTKRPAYILTKPRVGYRMANGEERQQSRSASRASVPFHGTCFTQKDTLPLFLHTYRNYPSDKHS